MKVGFSLGRCVRDIVVGHVDINDVYLIVSRTMVRDSSQLAGVVDEYLDHPSYLGGLDRDRCLDVMTRLYLAGRVHQPRLAGNNTREVHENAVWMDLMPVMTGEDQASQQVQHAWRQYQMALKLSSPTTLPDPNVVPGHLRDRF